MTSATDPNSIEYMPSALNKAQIDKFLLVLNIPHALKLIDSKIERNNATMNLNSLQFSVWGTVIPPISVPSVELQYMGGNMPVSTHARPSWDPVTVNFHVDSLWSNYWAIYRWINLMRSENDGQFSELTDQPKVLSKKSISIEDYSTDFTVYGLDEFNKTRLKWTYVRAFPTNLGSIAFNEQESSQISCTFTFQFSQLLCDLI